MSGLIPAAKILVTGSNTAADGLANASYAVLGTINASAANAVDIVAELTINNGTGVTGGVYLFAQASFDNTLYGTSTLNSTNEPTLYLIGYLPCPTASVAQTKSFSITQALGFTPPYVKLIAKNSTGAGLVTGGHSANYITYTLG